MLNFVNIVLNFLDVDGGLSEWTEWTKCSTSCGTGIIARERTCTNPVPRGKGKPCDGELTESKPCLIKECPSRCYVIIC